MKTKITEYLYGFKGTYMTQRESKVKGSHMNLNWLTRLKWTLKSPISAIFYGHKHYEFLIFNGFDLDITCDQSSKMHY